MTLRSFYNAHYLLVIFTLMQVWAFSFCIFMDNQKPLFPFVCLKEIVFGVIKCH